jgi:hypothetical protein
VVVLHPVDIGGAVQTRLAHRVPNEKIFPDQSPLVIDTDLEIPLTTEMCTDSLGRCSVQAQMSDLHTVRLLLPQEAEQQQIHEIHLPVLSS